MRPRRAPARRTTVMLSASMSWKNLALAGLGARSEDELT
jgi:hypothetical protein